MNTVSSGVDFLLNPELDTTRHYLGILEETTDTSGIDFSNANSFRNVSLFSNISEAISAIPAVSGKILNAVVDGIYDFSFNESAQIFINHDDVLNQGCQDSSMSTYIFPAAVALPVVAYLGYQAYSHYMQDATNENIINEVLPAEIDLLNKLSEIAEHKEERDETKDQALLTETIGTVSLSERYLGKKIFDNKQNSLTRSFNTMSLGMGKSTLSVVNNSDHSNLTDEIMLAADEVAKSVSKLFQVI